MENEVKLSISESKKYTFQQIVEHTKKYIIAIIVDSNKLEYTAKLYPNKVMYKDEKLKKEILNELKVA